MKTEETTGVVTNIDDPAKAGRIKVALESMDGQEYPEWIEPEFPPGWVTIPEAGDQVALVMPEGEDVVEFADRVRYKGKVHDDANPVPEEFRKSYPKRRGYKTKAGHLLIFDDDAGEITLTNGKSNDKIVMASNGQITITASLKNVLSSALTELSTGPLEPVLKGTTLSAAFTAYTGSIASAGATHAGSPKMAADNAAFITALIAATAALAATIATWISAKVQTG